MPPACLPTPSAPTEPDRPALSGDRPPRIVRRTGSLSAPPVRWRGRVRGAPPPGAPTLRAGNRSPRRKPPCRARPGGRGRADTRLSSAPTRKPNRHSAVGPSFASFRSPSPCRGRIVFWKSRCGKQSWSLLRAGVITTARGEPTEESVCPRREVLLPVRFRGSGAEILAKPMSSEPFSSSGSGSLSPRSSCGENPENPCPEGLCGEDPENQNYSIAAEDTPAGPPRKGPISEAFTRASRDGSHGDFGMRKGTETGVVEAIRDGFRVRKCLSDGD